MGWTSASEWTTKAAIVADILKDRTIAAHACKGNQLWVVCNNTSDPTYPEKVLVVFLLEKHGGVYAYKDMSEDMGPYCYDCPDWLLAMVPETSAAEPWRKARLRYLAGKAASKAFKASLQVGASVALANGWTLRIVSLKPLTGADASGKVWRIPARMLKAV